MTRNDESREVGQQVRFRNAFAFALRHLSGLQAPRRESWFTSRSRGQHGVSQDKGSFYLAGYFHRKPAETKAGWFPALNEEFQTQNRPIKVKKVRVEIILEQFFKYFKRFNVVLVDNALDITGREYEIAEVED
jgi:hypothetical protein